MASFRGLFSVVVLEASFRGLFSVFLDGPFSMFVLGASF